MQPYICKLNPNNSYIVRTHTYDPNGQYPRLMFFIGIVILRSPLVYIVNCIRDLLIFIYVYKYSPFGGHVTSYIDHLFIYASVYLSTY